MTKNNNISLAATAIVTTVVTATALYLGYRLYCQANPTKKYQGLSFHFLLFSLLLYPYF